jgi:hypothetical protein
MSETVYEVLRSFHLHKNAENMTQEDWVQFINELEQIFEGLKGE